MNKPISGIVPPMITPIKGRDELDIPGLELLIQHILSGGVSGLFILGTTGEGPSLSYRLRREVIERTCSQIAGRVPVLVGITDTAFEESISLTRHAAKMGATAVVAAPPYYLPEAQPELQEYLDHLVEALPLPLYIYNMPALTKVHIERGTVQRALQKEKIIGMKDSSGDMNYFKEMAVLLRERPDWPLLVGPEEKLFDALNLGGSGGISGGANMFPSLYVALYKAHQCGEMEKALTLQRQIQRISDSLYHVGKYSSSIIKGIKCALHCMDICDDFMAEPFHRFRSPERELVKERLSIIREEIACLKL